MRRFGEWIESVEQAWLGWTFPPVRRVLADAGWSPDEPAGYCDRCGGSVGRGETTGRGCGSCRGAPIAWDGIVRLGGYRGQLREWVRAIKYRGWSEMADALGRRLGMAVARRLRREGVPAAGAVVVPMPMPWQRRIYRGIDHARLIGAAVAAELSVPMVEVLAKANGPPQVSLAASDRARRRGGIRIRRRAGRLRLDDLQVVLVDDVRTSGATMRSACRLLRRLGPGRVLAAVLAVTDGRSRRGLPDNRPASAASAVVLAGDLRPPSFPERY
jgi:predicted amidophosphoribosyltransferase